MTIDEVRGDIGAVYQDWEEVLANPLFVRKDFELTWPNRTDKFYRYPLTRGVVAELASARQYSFQMQTDGSLIQLYFSFENRGRSLTKASLGYYQGYLSPYLPENRAIIIAAETDEFLVGDSSEDVILPSWFRIDYDPASGNGLTDVCLDLVQSNSYNTLILKIINLHF